MKSDHYWMKEALKVARKGMENNELPIASILVGGEREIGHGTTLTYSHNSPVAHGELFVLLNAQKDVYTCDRPLVLYTTLEPCIMCIGAAIECGVDKIVYGMPAIPDGGVCYTKDMVGVKESIPLIIGDVLGEEARILMQEFVDNYKDHPGWSYAESLVKKL